MIYLMYKSAKFGLVLTVTYLQIYIYIQIKYNFPFSFLIFHFPFSIFHLPFFIYNFSFSILHFSFSIFHLSFVIFHIIFGCVQYPEKYISKYTYFKQLLQLLFYYFLLFMHGCLKNVFSYLPSFHPIKERLYITSYQIHSLYIVYIHL